MTSDETLLFDDDLPSIDELLAKEVEPVKEHPTSVLTVERAAYGASALLAAGLRVFQLGLQPLSEGEAIQALAALRFAQGGIQTAPAGTIPALFTGNVAGFTLLGASDITARWLPVLAGMILVLLPYWLRHRLGRGGALAASLLLAFSPSAVHFSRTLDGAMVVAACGLALVVGLVNYVDNRRPAGLYAAAVALGVGLSAGPAFWSHLLILLVFGLVLYLFDRNPERETGWTSLATAWQAARDEKGLLVKAGIVLASSFGLMATALVLHPAGIGHAADLVGTWAQRFLPDPKGQPFIYPLLLLLRYEALVLLLGTIEAGRALVSRTKEPWWVDWPGSAFPLTLFLLFWAIAALLLIVVAGHRPAGNILLVVLPLALLAGQGLERAWRWVTDRGLWAGAAAVAGVALGMLVFFYLQLTAFSKASPASTVMVGDIALFTTSTYLILAGVALVLLAGLGIAAWIWRGPSIVIAGGWLAAVVVLGLFAFQAAWGLSVAHASDSRELMIIQTTVPGVRMLVEEMEDLSLDKSGDAHTLPITVEAGTGPVVEWYLREFKNQTVVDSLSTPPETVAVTVKKKLIRKVVKF